MDGRVPLGESFPIDWWKGQSLPPTKTAPPARCPILRHGPKFHSCGQLPERSSWLPKGIITYTIKGKKSLARLILIWKVDLLPDLRKHSKKARFFVLSITSETIYAYLGLWSFRIRYIRADCTRQPDPKRCSRHLALVDYPNWQFVFVFDKGDSCLRK